MKDLFSAEAFEKTAKEMSLFPIQRLETLREEMLRCSGLLKKYGYEERGKEMFGAAKILLTWIEGIGNENIQ